MSDNRYYVKSVLLTRARGGLRDFPVQGVQIVLHALHGIQKLNQPGKQRGCSLLALRFLQQLLQLCKVFVLWLGGLHRRQLGFAGSLAQRSNKLLQFRERFHLVRMDKHSAGLGYAKGPSLPVAVFDARNRAG